MTDVGKRLVELAEGTYVEEDVLGIVKKIQDYDDNLRVKFLDPNKADFRDAPYGIFEVCPDGHERLAFSVWELDERVLERLYAADKCRFNIQAQIDHTNAIARREEYRRYEERKLEDQDLVVSYLNSPKGRFSFKKRKGELVQLDDDPSRKSTKNGKIV